MLDLGDQIRRTTNESQYTYSIILILNSYFKNNEFQTFFSEFLYYSMIITTTNVLLV